MIREMDKPSEERWRLPCGSRYIPGTSEENWASICQTCFCVVGSVGMPRGCYEKWKAAQ